MFTKQRKLIQIGMVVVVIVAALSATGIVFAQASANYDLACWAIFSSGGGEMNISIEGEAHTLVSTLGQWYGSDTLPVLNDPSRRVVLFSGYIQDWDWLQPPSGSTPPPNGGTAQFVRSYLPFISNFVKIVRNCPNFGELP